VTPDRLRCVAAIHGEATASVLDDAQYQAHDQQAWDVATFMDSQERPHDPRFAGSVEATRAKYYDSPNSMYGEKINGRVLGAP